MNNSVSEYYDYTTPFYKHFWSGKSYGLHYGFKDDKTKNLEDELLNVNKVLSELAEINKTSKVLDAGCGVGGSSIWLAQNIGCNVTGITISKKQLEKAQRYSKENTVDDKTEFYLKDYLNTGFPDSSFDVVWAVESACHAKNKDDFLREAFRILKPNGKLILSDGFLNREPANKKETEIYETFLEGFVLENLSSVDGFRNSMEKIGFKNIESKDMTNSIKSSSEIMYKMSKRWYLFHKLLDTLKIIPPLMLKNIKTGIAQKEFFQTIGSYRIFIGTK